MPETTMTITLKPLEGEEVSATLLIQRGHLAQLRKFQYQGVVSLAQAVEQALRAVDELEANPPLLPPEPPEPQAQAQAQPKSKPRQQNQQNEPMLDIPSQRGSFSVPMNHITIAQGDKDAATWRQALLLAARLYDAGLWDGQAPLRLLDVHAAQRRMAHLSHDDLSKRYQLTDFTEQ
jgi:hypothetical protein